MRQIATLLCALLSGCAVQLTFIDKANGRQYSGTTGATGGNSGTAEASVRGVSYRGQWIYAPQGGGYTMLQNYQGQTFVGTTKGGSGNGLLTLTAPDASMRCVFTFSSMSRTGLGECQASDGSAYDLMIGK